MSTIIQDIENAQLKSDIPDFSPGDTVIVNVKVKADIEVPNLPVDVDSWGR